MRRMAGDQVTINPGNDTANRPFSYDPQAVLSSAGHAETAGVLVRGWGATHAGTFNQPPTIALTMQSGSSVAAGGSVTLQASADDAEDHSLTASIRWELVSAGPGAVVGTGETFTPTLSALGQHPIRFSVTDSGGKVASQLVTIQATGTLPTFSDVRLEEEPGLSSGTMITLRGDGRAAKWSVDQKFGLRANQGLYGDFWYFEGHRLIEEANQAVGLVIGGTPLDPYAFNTTPPSCSVNTVGPGLYQNLILVEQGMSPNAAYYGLAVDYRGDHPIVHVIVEGEVRGTLELRDATVPVYPMLYGNVTNNPGAAYDMEINFGPSFHENPVQALMNSGIDPSGLRLCWGTSNDDC
jgi:hypothetical protein